MKIKKKPLAEKIAEKIFSPPKLRQKNLTPRDKMLSKAMRRQPWKGRRKCKMW